jgi:hypothetical protein
MAALRTNDIPNPPANPTLVEDVAARLERLEKIVLEKNSSFAGTEWNTAKPSSSCRVVASPNTIRSLSVKGLKSRYFGQNSTKVLLNLVSKSCR